LRSQDESFGVIPLRKKNGAWEVFLIQHNKSGYWGFPKGHAEKGETPKEAAFRELKEETNLEPASLLDEIPLKEHYSFILDRKKVYKQVLYYVAEVRGEVKLQEQEIHNGKWIPFHQAITQVTHKEGKTLLLEVEKMLF